MTWTIGWDGTSGCYSSSLPSAMLPASIETLLCASILLGVICRYLCTRTLSSSRSVLPPGPPQLPLLGNVHQIPLEYQHKTFADWARKYGDLICIHAFHRPILIVSSANVARELLEKRGGKYSDRPYSILANKLLACSLNPFWDSCPTMQHAAASGNTF